MAMVPQRQRVAAYAVIVRDDRILLSRLAERVTRDELWTLPGGGLDHGEDPRDAVVREVYEETGLHAEVGDRARVLSAHLPGAWRDGASASTRTRCGSSTTAGCRVARREPRVVEVDGSTAEAAWVPLDDVRSGAVPVVPMVSEVLADLTAPLQRQRLAAYAVIRRDDAVLLTRISPVGPPQRLVDAARRRGRPRRAARRGAGARGRRGVRRSMSTVGDLLDVHDVHFTGVAPSGRLEDFHGVHLIFAASVVDER